MSNQYPPLPEPTVRKQALAIYKPPFKFYKGYIYDADSHVVADDHTVEKAVAARIRGWGRISYMPNAEAIQDEVGAIVAEALTRFWQDADATVDLRSVSMTDAEIDALWAQVGDGTAEGLRAFARAIEARKPADATAQIEPHYVDSVMHRALLKSATKIEQPPKAHVRLDGNQWMATWPDFINLQESPAGFGDTPELAISALELDIP